MNPPEKTFPHKLRHSASSHSLLLVGFCFLANVSSHR
jgi:hypothetical protein